MDEDISQQNYALNWPMQGKRTNGYSSNFFTYIYICPFKVWLLPQDRLC